MLQEELKKVKVQVDEFLKSFFAEKKRGIGKIHPEVRKMIEEIENVTLRGGDRFRPFMVWLGSQIRENPNANKTDKTKNREELIKLMCATELLHSFALIHDDIIDKAETRRGGPTIKPDEKAILAGDLCFTFADELLNSMSVEVKKIYDELREEVIAGEWLDVKFARDSWDNPRLKHPLKLIHEYKTARYSFEKPLMLGLIFIHNSGQLIRPFLQKYAINVGLAFQLKDDYLDLFGDGRLGKMIGGDIKEGNITIFHEHLIEIKDKIDFAQYCRIWHHANLTPKDIDWIKKLVEKSGVKKQVNEEMKKLIHGAKKELEKININPKIKKLLVVFADYVIEREY